MWCIGLLAMGAYALNVNIAAGKGDVAKCFNYNNPANAFDGNASTNCGPTSPYILAGLAVDLGSSRPLLKSVLNYQTASAVIQYYKIQGSDNGTTWTDILRVWNPTISPDVRTLPAVSYRYVRFVIPCGNPLEHGFGEVTVYNPNVNEIEIYERGAGDPAGDPAIAYPQPFDRTGWSAICNGGDYPQAVEKPDQGWLDPHGIGGVGQGKSFCFHQPMNAGDNIVVDMKSAKTFNMVSWEWSYDAFPNYSFYVSDDGANWGNPVFTDRDVAGRYCYSFPAQTKRYIKISNNEGNTNWWGFANVSIYNSPGAFPEDTGDGINIALNKTTTGVANGNLAVDGDWNTKTNFGTFIVDLGGPFQIARLHLKQNSNGNGYFSTISTSNDQSTWTAQQYINMSGENIVTANYSARYVRIEAPKYVMYGTQYFDPEFYEVQIFKSLPPGPRPNQPPSVSLTSPTANQNSTTPPQPSLLRPQPLTIIM